MFEPAGVVSIAAAGPAVGCGALDTWRALPTALFFCQRCPLLRGRTALLSFFCLVSHGDGLHVCPGMGILCNCAPGHVSFCVAVLRPPIMQYVVRSVPMVCMTCCWSHRPLRCISGRVRDHSLPEQVWRLRGPCLQGCFPSPPCLALACMHGCLCVHCPRIRHRNTIAALACCGCTTCLQAPHVHLGFRGAGAVKPLQGQQGRALL